VLPPGGAILFFPEKQGTLALAAGVVDLSTTKCEAAKIFVKP
jgi:hypothetical protein